MMTREEWQMQMMVLTHEETDADHYNAALHALETHDQAQRVVIERYREKVDEQAVDIIDHIDEKHKLSKQIEQQAKEIERLNARNEYVHREYMGVVDSYNSLEQENKTLREALQLLYDCQNGCPLPKYEADWNRAMELTEQALKEVA